MHPVDRFFHDQKQFIVGCDDGYELLDRMADYRDDFRRAEARGDTRAKLRMSDLLELAEDRLVKLKARGLHHAGHVAPSQTEVRSNREVRDRHNRQGEFRGRSSPTSPPPPYHPHPRLPPESDRIRTLRTQLAEARAACQTMELEREATEERERERRIQAEHAAQESKASLQRAVRERKAAEELAERRQKEADHLGEQRRKALEQAKEARRAAEQWAAAYEGQATATQRLREELEEAQAALERAVKDLRCSEALARQAVLARESAESRSTALEREILDLRRVELSRHRAIASTGVPAASPVGPPQPLKSDDITSPSTTQEKASASTISNPQTVEAAPSFPESNTGACGPKPSSATDTASISSRLVTMPHRAAAPAPQYVSSCDLLSGSVEPSVPHSPEGMQSRRAEQQDKAPAELAPIGADLARFRNERNLSQRAAAGLLGVGNGTISKAEREPTKALGPKLRLALESALRGEPACSP
jgi:DNA-binding XRE family transcriptional regulator